MNYKAFCLFFIGLLQATTPPKATIIIVIDQFAASYIPICHPHLKYGLKTLFDEGTSFIAEHPHAVPSTGPGHTCLSTGCLPNQHGIVANSWINARGKEVECDNDPALSSAVFNRDGSLQQQGKSSCQIMCDSFNDQLLMNARLTQSLSPNIIAISNKSRAAICMAGKSGKAIWLDPQQAYFTSSKAYFSELPEWITTFNEVCRKINTKAIEWKTCFPPSSKAYQAAQKNDYRYCCYEASLISPQCPSNKKFIRDLESGEAFCRTPKAGSTLTSCAKACIDDHFKQSPTAPLVMWLSLSNLDAVGHVYGPNSVEALDTIYHFDREIGELLAHLEHYVATQERLCVLTGDHGVMPIPEILRKEGYPAQRINAVLVTNVINRAIKKLFGIDSIIAHHKTASLFLNKRKFAHESGKIKARIIHTIKKVLLRIPGIIQAWTPQELLCANYVPNSIQHKFATQLFPARNGDIIYQIAPYTQVSAYHCGTDHGSPYHYDTQVPLVFWRPSVIPHKRSARRVLTTQLAPTLAHLFNVPVPSACTARQKPLVG